ncbi:MAG: NAD(P)H-hydrate dehydratase [Candidatus Omnitrophica bacterium]|nr:NAD(P)H-hydrate dehydratase [Candidatus Omnitrophota bacterium]
MRPRPEKKFPLLPRKKNSDKRNYGHALVLAGSRGLTGAAILASRAALVSGAGLTTLGCAASLQSLFSRSLVEVMTLGLPSTTNGALSIAGYSRIMAFIRSRGVNSIALGPGLGCAPSTVSLVRRLVSNAPVPIVLDADGLNAFRHSAKLLKTHRGPLVLTPHEREFERVFATAWPRGRKTRATLAKKLSKIYDGVLVLKGPGTLVVSGGSVYENPTGNPGMAKGGAGDVLTGVIASFIGQGLDVFRAACWGVYCHGLAADLAVKETGELALTASDILKFLPKAFR